MGKGTTALGIIGVILGAGGLGFGFLAWINQTQENVWYISSDSIHNPPSVPSPAGAIPDFSLIVSVNMPVSLHLLFTCVAVAYPVAESYSDFFYYFGINGVKLDNPWARVGPYNASGTTDRYSVTLQHFIPVIAPGIYNFTIFVISEAAGNYMRESTFCIRSYSL